MRLGILNARRPLNIQWLLVLMTSKVVLMVVTGSDVVYGYGDISPLSSLPFLQSYE